MTTTHHEHPAAAPRGPGMSNSLKTALLVAAGVGGVYLLREHWNHVADNWILLLLLACPLMHLFHGHGGHGGHGAKADRPSDKVD